MSEGDWPLPIPYGVSQCLREREEPHHSDGTVSTDVHSLFTNDCPMTTYIRMYVHVHVCSMYSQCSIEPLAPHSVYYVRVVLNHIVPLLLTVYVTVACMNRSQTCKDLEFMYM